MDRKDWWAMAGLGVGPGLHARRWPPTSAKCEPRPGEEVEMGCEPTAPQTPKLDEEMKAAGAGCRLQSRPACPGTHLPI